MRLSLIILLILISENSFAKDSIYFGTTKHGRLENGVKLPQQGPNFISYGDFPELSTRTYVHSSVKNIFVKTYKRLETLSPNKVYKYAETGFITPHKTHQNGLSIDCMVPVLNNKNKSAHFPTVKSNRYGYNVEFDIHGRNRQYKIDFNALAIHIVTLHKVAKSNGIDLWRVLFSPDLQDELYKTKYGQYIKDNVYIPTISSWVRHDEHYHVDFKVACERF